MSPMIEKRLQGLWSALKQKLASKKGGFPHFLSEIRLRGIRGIEGSEGSEGLSVGFDYPVSVIAGDNGSGKSTFLFAAACAYKAPETRLRDFVPSSLFPNYHPKLGGRKDQKDEVCLNFKYKTPEGNYSTQWRQKSNSNRWRRSPKSATTWPRRPVYLRTLSKLVSPSEVRSVLSMSRSTQTPRETALTESQVKLAHGMIPEYSELVNLSIGKKDLLFAVQKHGGEYSELHMSSGERAILHLSQEIAQLKDALILIDELEAGLHPRLQKLLMMQLQNLALDENNLQVIVTTHSPIVLNSVPEEGRIFLDRDEETSKVTVQPPRRDIIQNVLYGQLRDHLCIICEDKIAEGVVEGVLDALRRELDIKAGSVRIYCDIGSNDFASYARICRKLDQIKDFVFVLDGDQQGKKSEMIS